MKQIFLLFICSFTFSIVAAQTDKIKTIDSLIETANEIGILNGIVLIARDGKIVYQKEIGFADTTKSKFLKPDSRFAIGSITKEFYSVGILLLQENGKLSIDATNKNSRLIDPLYSLLNPVTGFAIAALTV